MDGDPPLARHLAPVLGAVVLVCVPVAVLAAGEHSLPYRWNPAIMALAIGLLAGVVNAIFTMAQTAVSAVGPFAVEQIEEEDSLSAKFLRRKLGALPRLEAEFTLAALFMLLLGCFAFTKAGILLGGSSPGVGAAVGITVALLLHLVFIEVYARSVALAHSLGTLRRVAPLAWALALPLRPVLWIGRSMLPMPKPGENPTAMSDMHLRLLPSLSGIERVMHEEAFELIDSVRDFADLTARDIMTPRTEVQGIATGRQPHEVYELLRESEYSRLVVFQDSMDHVRGVLLAKEVLLLHPKDPYTLLREALMAPEKTSLTDLLAMIRRHRTHLVVIQDEYGGTSGIVTLHDLFETIVGHMEDIEDEEELWILTRPDGTYRLNGRVELWELNDELGLDLDEDEARTVGGFVFHTLGRVASVGDVVELPGARFRVEAMVDNRVDEVILEIVNAEPVEEKERPQ